MKYLLPALTLLVLIVGSCGPDKPGEEKTTRVCLPENIRAEASSHAMTIVWDMPCTNLISGYNIYVSEKRLVGEDGVMVENADPFNHPPFPGDKNPDDGTEHFEAEGLDNGVPYYVSVRVVRPDQTLSPPTEEIVVVCGPRGHVDLAIRYSSDNDGFSFVGDSLVRADDLDNDIYYYHKDGVDYLASPKRLNGFLRDTRLQSLSFTGDYDAVAGQVMLLSSVPTEDRIRVEEGDWVRLWTPEGDRVLLQVVGFKGKGDNRSVELFYAVRPQPHS
ncbi:hypothetical protein GF356_08900 [candidate division GN15 bacterium]|nr:hypothetical protein [candidate division GN15 bacterium]